MKLSIPLLIVASLICLKANANQSRIGTPANVTTEAIVYVESSHCLDQLMDLLTRHDHVHSIIYRVQFTEKGMCFARVHTKPNENGRAPLPPQDLWYTPLTESPKEFQR